jgi:phosphonate transport system substrate-binding protein
MKSIMRPIITLLIISLLGPVPAFAQAGQPRVLIGLIPEMNVFRQKERFKLLGEYITQKTGITVEFMVLSRYGNIIDRFKAEKMDGAFFGSFTGALAIQKLGVIPLVRPVNPDNTSTYRGYLFARKDSGIRSVKDMKGKRMAFVERATTAGYVFPVAYLREHGVTDLDAFFSEYFFAGSHDAAIKSVLNRKADVGAAKHSMYDRIREEEPRVDRELTILAESPSVPSNGLCVRKDLDPVVRDRLRDALLALDRDPGAKQMLEKFGALRFIETTTQDYRPVFEMAREAGIDVRTYKYRNE